MVMQIGGVQKTTLIDYPGRIACTVFLIGCNFRCPFCYSSELVLPEKIKKQLHPPQVFAKQKFGRAGISEKDFFKFLRERKGLLDSVVLCGGEPCINKDLPEFCKKIKKLGYLVKIDTNGSNPEMLKKLIDEKLVDYVAMDIKAPLEPKSQISNLKSQNYDRATGVKVDLNKIKKSIDIIKNSGIDCEFRTTIVPGIHTKEDILEIAREIGRPTRLRVYSAEAASAAKAEQSYGGRGRYFLQNFRPEKTLDPKFEKIKPYPQEFLLEIQKAIAPFFEICQIR